MFKTLLIKEIQSAIIDFRFWIVTVLCICIIPLSFYVSVKNYSQKVADYHQEIQSYRETTDIYHSMEAQGIHPPSPLSIFSQGLDYKMPYKVLTSRDGQYKIEYAKPDGTQDLMGKIDFAYVVIMVLSILALVFTFSAISGDKENGIFRLVLSNPVLRRQVLTAKLTGNFIVFLIPYLLSIMIAFAVVYFSGIVPIFSAELFPPVLIILGISIVFLFALFCLGLWMSSFAKNSTLSINVLLLIWIIIGLVIPKTAPIISEVIYPVESTGVFEMRKKLLIQNINKEQIAEEIELYERLRAEIDPESQGVSTAWNDLNDTYDNKVVSIREKYEQLKAAELGKLVTDYQLRRNKQNRIAKTISSMSVINLANNLMAEFSSTGYSEAENFLNQSKQFQETIESEIYSKLLYKVYRTKSGTASTTDVAEGFNMQKSELPAMENYTFLRTKDIFMRNITDIILIACYCLLFFVGAFISFTRFDVR